jgi:hypothetical protein
MKNTIIFILALLLFCSCNNREKKHISNNKNIISKDTCLDGFIIIQYRGEVDHPVKSLLIRTDKKDSTYFKYIGDKSVVKDSFSRRFELNEIILVKSEFETIKNYITAHNNKKRNIIVDNGFNSQEIILLTKCDTLDYIVDRTDTMYFKNLIDIIKGNDLLRKYFEYSRKIQERRFEGSHN